MAGEPWTGSDVLRLRQEATRRTPDWAELARALGRSPRACREKAKRLHLREEPTGYTNAALAARLGYPGALVAGWRAKGWLRGRKVRRGWAYSHAAVRAFLRAHPDVVDTARVDMVWLVDVLAGGTGTGSERRRAG